MKTPLNNEVAFRPATASDTSFVFDSWLRSWRTSPGAGTIRNDMYYPVQRATIEGLIGRGATIEVACLATDPERILGWCCSEQVGPNAVIHYVYTKDAYLPLGIGEELVRRAAGLQLGLFTHNYRQVTDVCVPRARGGEPGWRYAPEIARRK